MKTRVDALTTFPRPAKAANEEFALPPAQKVSSGWDAYEVWLTRVKAPREDADRAPQHG